MEKLYLEAIKSHKLANARQEYQNMPWKREQDAVAFLNQVETILLTNLVTSKAREEGLSMGRRTASDEPYFDNRIIEPSVSFHITNQDPQLTMIVWVDVEHECRLRVSTIIDTAIIASTDPRRYLHDERSHTLELNHLMEPALFYKDQEQLINSVAQFIANTLVDNLLHRSKLKFKPQKQ